MSKEITIPYNFIPRSYQLDLLEAMDTGCKRSFLRWHRRAGKDKACAAYMFKEMVRRPGLYYYFFPTYSQGRKALWEDDDSTGFKTLNHLLAGTKAPGPIAKSINNQDMKIELNNGSIFRIIGTDKIDSIVGTNPRGCVFSEYAVQDKRAWEYISPILEENGGWAIFNSTPRGENHMYRLEQGIQDDPEWYVSVLQSLWPEDDYYSGIVSPERISAKRREGIEEELIESEYGVSYSSGLKGSFYSDCLRTAQQEGRIGMFPVDGTRTVDTFWDIGRHDDTVVWFRQTVGDAVYWIDYYENSGQDISFYVDVLRNKGYNYGTHYIPHDMKNNSMHPSSVLVLFKDYCVDRGISSDVWLVEKTNSVQDDIYKVRSRFGKYYFNAGTTGVGIDKLRKYHRRWDPKREMFLAEPVHDSSSHSADSFRMEATCPQAVFGGTFSNQHPANSIKVVTEFNPYD